jgi:hypothetical protein
MERGRLARQGRRHMTLTIKEKPRADQLANLPAPLAVATPSASHHDMTGSAGILPAVLVLTAG